MLSDFCVSTNENLDCPIEKERERACCVRACVREVYLHFMGLRDYVLVIIIQ